MKLIINTSVLRFGGAVQGALSLINECRNFPEHEYFVFVGRGIGKSLNMKDFPANFYFYNFDFGPVSLWKTPIIGRKLSYYENTIKPDYIITTSGPSYWHSNAPQLMGFNLGLYIYPESPFIKLMSMYRRIRLNLKRRIHYYFFRRDASAYIVQTDDVNRRVRKALKIGKVFTVSNTHSGFYNHPKKVDNKLPVKIPGEVRLLTLTSYYRHKDLEIILELSDELNRRGLTNVRFILTIDQENYNRIFGKTHKETVSTVGPVKPEECPSLYSECDIMFLPTLVECFSASYPEAMVMKRPIVTTDLGFARNICENAALYYEAMNPIAAADTIESLLKDKNLQNTLIENGLLRLKHFDSARERAKKILSICGKLRDEGKN